MTLDVIHGDMWKNIRKHLSPTFTSGRLKAMMEPIAGEVDKMVKMMEETVADKGAANLTPLMEGTVATTKFIVLREHLGANHLICSAQEPFSMLLDSVDLALTWMP